MIFLNISLLKSIWTYRLIELGDDLATLVWLWVTTNGYQLVLLLLYLLFQLLKFTNNRFEKKASSKRLSVVFSGIDVFHDMIEETSVERVMFLRATKTGTKLVKEFPTSVPERVNTYRVTALTNWHKDQSKHYEKLQYIDIEVSNDYNIMLNRLCRDYKVEADLNSLKPGGTLRKIYEKEGIKYSKVYLAATDQKNSEIYYYSVASYVKDFRRDAKTRVFLSQKEMYIRRSLNIL